MIFCCGCQARVWARLTNGREIYPHRPDLSSIPFWRCDKCRNYVGCHHKTIQPTKPLGVIPTPELRDIRQEIHAEMDRLMRLGHRRGFIYRRISDLLRKEYHTAELRSVVEASQVLAFLSDMGAPDAKVSSSSNQGSDRVDNSGGDGQERQEGGGEGSGGGGSVR